MLHHLSSWCGTKYPPSRTQSTLSDGTAMASLSGHHSEMVFLHYRHHRLADRWGTTVDFTTSFLHSSQFSAFRSMIFHSRPVHSLMLSSHHFLYLPLRLLPGTVPCRVVLASPDDHVNCPYHFSLCLFTEVRRYGEGWAPQCDIAEDTPHVMVLPCVK